MTKTRRFAEYRLLQTQLLYYHTRTQVKVLLNYVTQLLIAQTFPHCTIAIHIYRKRVRDPDPIGYLHHATFAKFRSYETLSYPTSCISAASVHFGRIFTRESAAPMAAPASISVHNDFTTCQSSIAIRTAKHKTSRRIQVINRFVVQILCRNHWLNDFLAKVLSYRFLSHHSLVLNRYQHIMDSDGDD